MIPFIIHKSDYLEKEEKRKKQVLDYFIEQRHQVYEGVSEWAWKAQLELELMSKSEALKFALDNPSTFKNSYGSIEKMDLNLHSTDDQGFEGQVILRNGKKHFFRWFLDMEEDQ